MKTTISEIEDLKEGVIQGSQRGVTLTEILVVLAIVGVLSAVIAPVYINVVDGAQRVRCTHQLQTIGNAVLEYEFEHGVLPGPLYSHEGGEFTLHAYLSNAGYLLDGEIWLCPSNHGARRESLLAEESTYVVNNADETSPSYFFGSHGKPRALPLERVLAENPSGVWLLRDSDVLRSNGLRPNDTGPFDPSSSPGLNGDKPPHAKGRNYFFSDGHIKHLKLGNFPS